MRTGLLALRVITSTAKCTVFWQFFRKDGSLMRSGSFVHDRQIGIWKTFDREGKLVKETDFGD